MISDANDSGIVQAHIDQKWRIANTLSHVLVRVHHEQIAKPGRVLYRAKLLSLPRAYIPAESCSPAARRL
jgi:hypothetical protein